VKFNTSPVIAGVDTPPISEAGGWLDPATPPERVINLCQAVPSYAPAEALMDEVGQAAHEAGTGVYTDVLGTDELRARYAQQVSSVYGTTVASSEVAITAGCNQAFCVTMMALGGAGDNVLLTTPWYFNHDMWLRMLGMEVRTFPAITPGSPYPDPEAAAALIDDRTRAIVLCTPNNPTGSVYPAEVLAAFHDLCAARGIALVLDETYLDFRDTDERPHDLFDRPDWGDTLIQLYSFSKVFALTGYRVGAITARAQALIEIEKIMDCVAICAPHIGQRAALFGLNHLHDWKREKAEMMAHRTATLRHEFATQQPGWELASSGAYFAYVRHPFSGVPSKQVAMHLAKEHAMLCLPGSVFGPGQDDYLRLAFANVGADRMAEVVQRLAASTATATAAFH
jgi:aspartate/methionine/tyrosine aminotransferase